MSSVNFNNSNLYNIISFFSDDILICANFTGQIDIWDIDHESYEKSEIIQSIEKINKT